MHRRSPDSDHRKEVRRKEKSFCFRNIQSVQIRYLSIWKMLPAILIQESAFRPESRSGNSGSDIPAGCQNRIPRFRNPSREKMERRRKPSYLRREISRSASSTFFKTFRGSSSSL